MMGELFCGSNNTLRIRTVRFLTTREESHKFRERKPACTPYRWIRIRGINVTLWFSIHRKKILETQVFADMYMHICMCLEFGFDLKSMQKSRTWSNSFFKCSLFLAALGLPCRVWACCSHGKWGLLSSCNVRASHCSGCSCCRHGL